MNSNLFADIYRNTDCKICSNLPNNRNINFGFREGVPQIRITGVSSKKNSIRKGAG